MKIYKIYYLGYAEVEAKDEDEAYEEARRIEKEEGIELEIEIEEK